MWQNLTSLFDAIGSEKYVGYAIGYVKLARYVKLAVDRHDHDKGQSGIIPYIYLQFVVSIVLYEAKTVLGLFCLQLNTIG